MKRQVAINLLLTAVTAITVQFGSTQKAHAQKTTNEFTHDCIQKFQQGLFPSEGNVEECSGVWHSYEQVLRKRLTNKFISTWNKENQGKKVSQSEIDNGNKILDIIRNTDVKMLLKAAKRFDELVSAGEHDTKALVIVKGEMYEQHPLFPNADMNQIRILSRGVGFPLEQFLLANSIHAK